MDVPKLVKMANQIATFFEAEPDHAIAVEGVAGHLRRFWEPRMRKELLAHIDATGGSDLRPLALEAARTLPR